MRAEQVTEPVAYHAEGPVWSSALGRPTLGWHAGFTEHVRRQDSRTLRRRFSHLRASNALSHRHTCVSFRPVSRYTGIYTHLGGWFSRATPTPIGRPARP